MTYIRIETSETTTVRLEHHVAAGDAAEAVRRLACADIVRVVRVDREISIDHASAAPARELPWQACDTIEAIQTLLAGSDAFTVHVRLRTMLDTMEIAVVSIDDEFLTGQLFPSTSDLNMTIPLSDIASMRIDS